MKILNTWKSDKVKKEYYNLNLHTAREYSNGRYHIVSHVGGAYLYIYETENDGYIAFNCLGGINKDHLDSVATKNAPCRYMTVPTGTADYYLYERALETIERALKIINP